MNISKTKWIKLKMKNINELYKQIENSLFLLNPQDQQEFDQGNKSLELGAIFTV